jgi:hypothetical protein
MAHGRHQGQGEKGHGQGSLIHGGFSFQVLSGRCITALPPHGSDSATLNRGAWEKLVGIGGEALFPPEETVKQIRIRKTRA